MTKRRRVSLADQMAKTVSPRTSIGERVEQARLLAGYETQPSLAKAVGLTVGTIWRVETGGKALSKGTAKKLARALKVSEAWLMYGDGGGDEAKRPAPFEKLVQQYLASEIGLDTPPAISQRLNMIDYSLFCVAKPGVKDVHRVRELIEFNFALGRKRPT